MPLEKEVKVSRLSTYHPIKVQIDNKQQDKQQKCKFSDVFVFCFLNERVQSFWFTMFGGNTA